MPRENFAEGSLGAIICSPPGVCLVWELVHQILDHAVHLRPVLEHDHVAGGRRLIPEPIIKLSPVFINSNPIPALQLQVLCVLITQYSLSTKLPTLQVAVIRYFHTKMILYVKKTI